MKPRIVSRIWVCLFAWVFLQIAAPAQAAAQQVFRVNGRDALLEEAAEFDVYFSSLRLNRLANEWNVEATLSNKTARAISAPVVLMIETVANSTGLLRADGTSDGKRYLDMSAQMPLGYLAAPGKSTARTLGFGVVGQSVPTFTTRVFKLPGVVAGPALGFVRTLDGIGHPLSDVQIEELSGGPSILSGETSGVATLGGGGAGAKVWKFSQADYLPAWREATLVSNTVTLIPYPRLTRRANALPITPAAGGAATNGGAIVRFAGGAFSQEGTLRLTALNSQSLPAFLPAGWSPMEAFWIELSSEPATAGALTAAPWGPIGPTERATLVKLIESTRQWEAVQIVSGAGGGALAFNVGGSGAYAVVIPDASPNQPPAAVVGSALQAASSPAISVTQLRAGGKVMPSVSPASLDPDLVTAMAEIIVTNLSGAMVSGTLLRGEFSERYQLRDGSHRYPPMWENFIVAYQRPGDARGDTLAATFPIRPSILFGPSELVEGVARVDLLTVGGFTGGVLDSAGGAVTNADIRIVAAAGDFSAPEALKVRQLSATNFIELAGGGMTVAAAFELELNHVASGRALSVQVSGIATNSQFVLAQTLTRSGLYGLEPRLRLLSDAAGTLIALDPVGGENLPGVTGSGQYVLLQVNPQQAVVSGIARNAIGAAASGMPVRIEGQPWLTFSGADGSFRLLAPAGQNSVQLTDLTTHDSGSQTVTVTGDLAPVNGSVAAGATGLRVVSISPTNNAISVQRVAAVTVTFNRPLNPATVVQGIQIAGTNGVPISASASLNLAGTVATILPQAQLDPASLYQVFLSADLADTTGRKIEGPRAFQFTTVALPTRDLGAQLIIYEPGATNVPASVLADIPAYTPGTNRSAIVVRGTPGAADPGVPVVLVNESTSETATILSKPDGSFTSIIEGTEADFVSATFINLNKTRIYVPVSRQLFDNGFVGLYKQGGILEAQSDGGPVRVYIEPEAIETKTKLRLKTLNAAQLAKELGGTQPEEAKIAGTAIVLEGDGEPITGPTKMSFNVDLAALGFPQTENPTNAAIVLARVTDDQDVKAFEVVDQLRFTPATPTAPSQPSGKIATRKPIARAIGSGEQVFYGVAESVIGLIPGADQANTIFRYIFVPLLIGGKPITVKGLVFQSYEVEKILNPLPGLLSQITPIAAPLDDPSSTIETITDILRGRPLSGAFITLQNYQTPATPGRLRPGMIYTTSGAKGDYLMVVPTTPALQLTPESIYVLMATHPSFKDKQSEGLFALTDISLAGVVFKNFVFREPWLLTAPPQVNVAHTPSHPAAGEAVEVQVNATQGFAGAPEVNVFIDSVSPTNQTEAGVRIFDVVKETLSGNRTRWTGKIQATNTIRAVVLRVSAISGGGTVHPAIRYAIPFIGQPQRPDEIIPPSDPTEKQGPVVTATFPSDGSVVGESGQIRVVFNEPISKLVESDVTGIVLSGPGGPYNPVVRLSSDQTELTLQYAGLLPGENYSLTLSGASIRDLNGNDLDQRPSTAAAESFSARFSTAPVNVVNLPGISNGRGSAIHGAYLYVIDDAATPMLRTYDISVPSAPQLLSSARGVGTPRDLVVIPNYAFKTRLHEAARTNDLVAVVGGTLDFVVDDLDSVIVKGQYLRIFDMADPRNPVELAAPILTYRLASAVTKIQWHPPLLVYQEFAADIHNLGFIDLQELLIGFNATPVEIDGYPANGKEGVDRNGDGDYADEGDSMPLPERRPVEFFGKKKSIVVSGTTQKVLDFSVSGGTVGVTLTRGVKLSQHGQPTSESLFPQYRTLNFNGFEVNAEAASFNFPNGAFPGRVTIIDGLPIEIDRVLKTPVVALVSLAPDEQGKQKLAIIDITLPEAPKELSEIFIPDSVAGGALETIKLREDGLLEYVTSQNVLLLEPRFLGATNPPDTQLHRSIVGFIPRAGAISKTVGSSLFGIRSVSEGNRNTLIQTTPTMSFVHFPTATNLVDARNLPQSEEGLSSLMEKSEEAFGLVPARVRPNLGKGSDIFPANLEVHYYVMLQAPGGSGSQIKIGVESLTAAGWPQPNKGAGFAPVRAAAPETLTALGIRLRTDCDAPIQPLTAYRMSNDKRSAFYNKYLSQPIVLLYESVNQSELASIQIDANRAAFWSGANLQAFIEPTELGNTTIGAFAGKIDSALKIIRPVASVTAPTLDVSYIMGANPPPAGGYATMSGTQGTISSHSGEFRTESTDLTVPSRRMPISIQRAIGGQDSYDGPFGLGWDFNYNQRITELQPFLFPEGFKMPLVPRGTIEDSVIGSSKDVLFHTGMGRIVLFRWASDAMPPEYEQDPLVIDLKYADLVADYYLPEAGVFDLLVKFKDGKYERLTPDGERFKYAANGRLEKIIDRFPLNTHELEYDRQGLLTRITDRSVTTDRYLEFGHYRRPNDPDFIDGLDERSDNSFVAGKINKLRDFAGTDVLFFYDDFGFLIRREGPQVAGENGGFSGRNKTHYQYDQCKIIGMAVGADGAPIITAKMKANEAGQPVAERATGTGGAMGIDVPNQANSAKLENLKTSNTRQDNSKVETTFDKFGYVKSTKVSGEGSADAVSDRVNDEHGQPTFLKFPEGNTRAITYDRANPNYRSRGNLVSIAYDAGPRGGENYTETFSYDPRYNLRSGAYADPNGFAHTSVLRGDGREVASITHQGAGDETYSYNDYGQLIASRSTAGLEVRMDFDASTGYLQKQWNGENARAYSYDGSHASKLGMPAAITPPRGAPSVIQYDRNLQETETRRGDLIVKTAYDEQGRAIYESTDFGNGVKREQRTTLDAKGFVTRTQLDGVDVNGAPRSIVYEFTPDPLSRVKTVKHPEGGIQTFEYDAQGRRTKSTFGDYVEEFAYNLHGGLKTVKQGGDVVEELEYDGFDRPKLKKKNAGATTIQETSQYFKGGELKEYRLSDTLFGLAQSQSYGEVDSLGRPKQVTLNGSAISPAYTYLHESLKTTLTGPRMASVSAWNSAGHKTGYTDPLSAIVITPNENGYATRVERREEGATYADVFGYDELDNRTTVGDLLGNRFNYLTRPDGKYLSITNARGNFTAFEHTALGELTRMRRSDGLEMRHRFDAQRQESYVGDPAGGFGYTYDTNLRLKERTLRNGAAFTYGSFDTRNMPRSIAQPGGALEQEFDALRRLTKQKSTYQSTTYESTFQRDALDRVRKQTYASGGLQNTASFEFDPSAVLTSERYQEYASDFTVSYEYYADGTRRLIKYPSNVSVTEVRDATGRLTGVTDGGGNIIRATSWQGNNQPKSVELGTSMAMTNSYDARGRLTGTVVTRKADSAVLIDMRYAYDGVDNLTARQWMHRGGRMDLFRFDNGERVDRAQMAGLPLSASQVVAPAYTRAFAYNATGLDYLASATLTPATALAPAFAKSWTGQDAFLAPAVVDGFSRGESDPVGNVKRAQLWPRLAEAAGPAPIASDLLHNGFGSLVKVTRADGRIIENEFRPDGIRYLRRVNGGNQPPEAREFVYDSEGRLLEEYDRSISTELLARYYYSSSDAPVAADLRVSGQMRRYYYLRDAAHSVIAVADENGQIVERVSYDVFGQPAIEQPDTAAPTIHSVREEAGGKLLVVLSEAVAPRLTAAVPAEGIVPIQPRLNISINLAGGEPAQTVTGDAELVVDSAEPNGRSVIRFTPSAAMTGPVSLAIPAGAVVDEWGNANAARSVNFTITGNAGSTDLAVAPEPATAPVHVARSAVNSPILFHGQYFDYEMGLLYLRARFYDPFSGMFLEPDPLGYEDSVNLYAAMGNNPVSFRDPTGLARRKNRGGDRSEMAHGNVHGFLSDAGLTDLEVEAMVNVLSRRDEKINVSIRRFQKYDWKGDPLHVDTAGARRYYASQSIRNKDETNKAKLNEAAIGWSGDQNKVGDLKHGEWITSDLDALHVEINGQFASVQQIRDLFGEFNGEFERLHINKFKHLEEAVRPKPNPPFQHEAHAHLLSQLGNPTSKDIDPSGHLSYGLIGKIGHPGDAFQISVTGTGPNFGIEARDLSRTEVRSIMNRGADDFRRRKNSDPAFRKQLEATGNLSVQNWPNSFRKFKNGEEGL